MSGKKISEMTAITGAQLDQTNDVVPILDVSDTSNPNKKISIQELASVIGASGTTNVSLALDGSNNLTLTDSDANTVTVDLSSLDNSTLTLADVTANGAGTTEEVTFSVSSNSLTNLTLYNTSSSNGVKLQTQFGYLNITPDSSTAALVVRNNAETTSYASVFASSSYSDFAWRAGTSDQTFIRLLSDGKAGLNTTPSVTLDIQGTDAVQLTSGTTAERPTTPANGMIRYNSDDDVFEGYAGGAWEKTSGLTLADVTANGAVTGDAMTITDATIHTPQLNRAAFSHKNFAGLINSVALYQFSGGNTVLNAPSGSQVDLSINNSFVGRVKSNGMGIFTTPSVTLDIQGTDAVQLTAGTTAERPTAAAGMIRFNTTTSKFEGYDGTSWIDLH